MTKERKIAVVSAGISTVTDANGLVTRRWHVTGMTQENAALWMPTPGAFQGNIVQLKTPVKSSADAAKQLLEMDVWTKAERAFIETIADSNQEPVKVKKVKGETAVQAKTPAKKLNDVDAAAVKAANLAKIKEAAARRKQTIEDADFSPFVGVAGDDKLALPETV